jgi:hypothetical protein
MRSSKIRLGGRRHDGDWRRSPTNGGIACAANLSDKMLNLKRQRNSPFVNSAPFSE